ncbi:MAG: BrxA family protein [Acidimicrobiia bacterium]
MSDFDNFLRSKSLWHEELNELKESTRNKLRTTLFLMMREANLLSNSDQIIQTQVSSRVAEVLAGRIPSELRFFPCTDADFKGAGK